MTASGVRIRASIAVCLLTMGGSEPSLGIVTDMTAGSYGSPASSWCSLCSPIYGRML